MEDFVYILLAAVWLVISLLGSKKKKKPQSAPQPKPQSYEEAETVETETQQPPVAKESDFDDMLEEFFGTDDKPKQKPTAEPKPQPAYSEERTYHDDSSRHQPGSEKMSDEKVSKYEGATAIDEDFEFSGQKKAESLDELIKIYEERYKITDEEDKKLSVVDIEKQDQETDWEFDGRKAIIYSEIINKKYT